MVYWFDVRGVNTGTRNLPVSIMVSLLLQKWVKENDNDKWMVHVPYNIPGREPLR